jgi:hypothetical protein
MPFFIARSEELWIYSVLAERRPEMVENAAVEEQDQPDAGGERERSTIPFPYADLDNAIRIAKGIREVGGVSSQWEQLAAKLDVAVKGGAFRLMAAAAKVFGLVTYSKGGAQITSLGQRICDSRQEKAARAEAFLNVPLYKAIYERYKSSTIPPQAGLEADMVALGVSKKVVDKARQVFQRSAQQAGFFWAGQDRLVMPATGAPISDTPEDHKPKDPDPDAARKSDDGGSGRGRLIDGLIEKLPLEGADWSLEDRHRWLQLAAGIFDFVYKTKNNNTDRRLKIELLEGSAK